MTRPIVIFYDPGFPLGGGAELRRGRLLRQPACALFSKSRLARDSWLSPAGRRAH
ncbi:hypothetical protein [Paenibacillus elgii]|uniref:hypothetical protein n=1 Tax=Paenibacillus elgii TaxID=189691 RepID=UPI000248DE77|nr:hypothetical protein [Paenibacillus elgii]